MESKYMVLNHNEETFEFFDSKEEAEFAALNEINSRDDEVSIYKVKRIGIAYIPDPDPTIEWIED